MAKECTITYTAKITEILDYEDDETTFLPTEDVIKSFVRNKLKVDDVQIEKFKIFMRDKEE